MSKNITDKPKSSDIQNELTNNNEYSSFPTTIKDSNTITGMRSGNHSTLLNISEDLSHSSSALEQPCLSINTTNLGYKSPNNQFAERFGNESNSGSPHSPVMQFDNVIHLPSPIVAISPKRNNKFANSSNRIVSINHNRFTPASSLPPTLSHPHHALTFSDQIDYNKIRNNSCNSSNNSSNINSSSISENTENKDQFNITTRPSTSPSKKYGSLLNHHNINHFDKQNRTVSEFRSDSILKKNINENETNNYRFNPLGSSFREINQKNDKSPDFQLKENIGDNEILSNKNSLENIALNSGHLHDSTSSPSTISKRSYRQRTVSTPAGNESRSFLDDSAMDIDTGTGEDHGNEKNNSMNIISNITTDSPISLPSNIKTFRTIDPDTEKEQTWQCVEIIGEGTFSKVYSTINGQVAIKVSSIPKNDDTTMKRVQSSLVRELELLRIIDHKNIIKLIGYADNQNEVIMAIPLLIGGDLFNFASKYREHFNAELIRIIFSNIVSAIYYLHNNDIIHRDIKLENILLNHEANDLIYDNYKMLIKINNNNTNNNSNNNSDGENDDNVSNIIDIAVLSDFGLAKKLDKENSVLTTRCGSEDYVSPELLLGLAYDGKQNDIWSLGVLLYTLMEGRLPFDALPMRPGEHVVSYRRRTKSRPAHRIALISWDWFFLKDIDVDDKGNDWSMAKEIVNHCLVKRDSRITIADIYNSPYCKPYV